MADLAPLARVDTRGLAAEMAEAASAWLARLDDRQADVATFAGPGSEERLRWCYTPTDHGGLALRDQGSAQQQLAMRLVATGLSEAGFVAVSTIIGLENVLDRLEGWSVAGDRERGRDPGLYYLSVFGRPGAPAWAWRFGGHHVSLNHLVVDGHVASMTPQFLGVDPTSSPLSGRSTVRPLGATEDVARELVRSLSEEQRRVAVLHPDAPADIIGGNRAQLTDGDVMLPLTELWRGRFEDPKLLRQVESLGAEMKRASGLGVEDHRRLAYSEAPKGISASSLRPEQQRHLDLLMASYFERSADVVARAWASYCATPAVRANLSFAWAGGTEDGDPHYYRIQGPRLPIEYDNTQRHARHVHSALRDPAGDFGMDVAGAHRPTSPA